MAPVWRLARRELRSRWLSLLGLTVIVAIAAAVLLTATVGARRTSTAVERFREWSGSADALPQSNNDESGEKLEQIIAGLPYVTASTTRFLVNGFPLGTDDSIPDFAMYTDPSGRYGVDIDRPRLLEGRLPDAVAPDEIAVDELTAGMLKRGIGDHIELATWTPEDLEALFSGTSFPGFNGPSVDLTVVGVTRSPATLEGQVGRATLTALAGPRFLEAHPGIGAWPPVIATRLEDPGRDIPRLTDELAPAFQTTEIPEIETASSTYLTTTEQSVSALTTGLWIFALVAGLAAAVTVGQAISRQVGAATRTSEVTRALGLTRRARTIATALPAVLAGAVGVVVGAGLAIACSPLLPTGLARRAEIDPGVWVDPWTLVVGGALVIAAVMAWAALAAWRAQRRAALTSPAIPRPSSVADRLASWGLPAPIVTGVRHAFEGYGGLSVPVRSALVAATVAVTGIVGAGVVAVSVDRLNQDSTRWGWTWSSEPDAFGDTDPTEALTKDDRLAGVAIGTSSTVEFGDVRVAAASAEPLKGPFEWVIPSGRAPTGASEVALGRKTMDALGVTIGDHVTAGASDSPDRTVDLTVVGSAVLSLDAKPGEGAILTPEGLTATSRDQPSQNLLLRYPDGADVEALEQQLRDDYDLSFPPFSHAAAPAEVRNLDQGRGVAVALAVFFSVLGIAGLFHALTVSTRGRRGDFAVLRAMGFRRRQVRETVLSQSTAIAVVGLIIGIPLGPIVGRAFWARLVNHMGVLDWPSTPWLLLVVVVPAALAAAVVIAALPARSAAHSPTSQVLRGD